MRKHLLLGILLSVSMMTFAQSPETFKKWGDEVQALIKAKYKHSDNKYLYRDSIGTGHTYAWPIGIQLKAFIYAGDETAAENLYKEFHAYYLCTRNGYQAYDAVYKNCGDRYYDDNAWIAKDLMDLYALTENELYLNRAKLIMKFCMSGKCVDGGILFHENFNDPSHEHYTRSSTCATSPVCATNLRLYMVTEEQSYLDDAKSLYHAMRDDIGWGIGPGYRGYENAVVMQCALLLYQATKEQQYLDDTYRLANSMETRYISWDSGKLNEIGKWGGHDMTDAYVYLYEEDGNPRWLSIVARYLSFLYENCKDKDGFYPEDWNNTNKTNPGGHFIEQASAAAAFYKMALTPGVTEIVKDPVAVYQDRNYGGWSLSLPVGEYTRADLIARGMTDTHFNASNDITSVEVTEGYKVILYRQDKFGGRGLELTESMPELSSSWNDQVFSIKVIDLSNPTAIENIDKESNIKVSPTLFNDYITIENLNGTTNMELLDISGRLILKQQTNNTIHQINTSDLPQGIYLLKVGTRVFKVKKR